MKNFNEFGGQYVPETLMNCLHELKEYVDKYIHDEDFQKEYMYLIKNYVGGPSPLYYAKRLSEELGGGKIYLKREDLNHTGAHKINNVIGQILLAQKMGKKKIIAETGAGQHGVATATGAALFGMECIVFMGAEDIDRQRLNVNKMELLGAKVVSVETGSKTLKDATNTAIKHWVANAIDTYYVIGSVVGPAPYPYMVREFQRIIGDESRKQIYMAENRLPDYVLACVGGGSNAIGMFTGFIDDESVKLIGIEAGGMGVDTDKHAASITKGEKGIIHGMKTMLLRDENGQILPVHSISAGLDYPGVGPEHAYLNEIKRAKYEVINDDEAIEAFYTLTRLEGIIPALESAHAIAQVIKLAPKTKKDEIIIVNLSGRGDKDMETILGLEGKL